jgi:hypothetical protein
MLFANELSDLFSLFIFAYSFCSANQGDLVYVPEAFIHATLSLVMSFLPEFSLLNVVVLSLMFSSMCTAG